MLIKYLVEGLLIVNFYIKLIHVVFDVFFFPVVSPFAGRELNKSLV